MKEGTTLFLKLAIVLVGIPILAACIFGLSRFSPDSVYWEGPELGKLQYPILIGMYAAMIPFFFALYQALKLLAYIDKNQAFSELTVICLKKIKFCAIAIISLYAIELPFFYSLAKADDAPAVLIGIVIIFASMVIAVFAAVLERLLQHAIKIKSENDQTV